MATHVLRGQSLLGTVPVLPAGGERPMRPRLWDESAQDKDLLDGLARGDSSALTVLYDRHADTVFLLLARILTDRDTAEDLLQEAFLRAWQHAETYQAERGSVRCWLRGIAHNLAINELRRQRRRPRPAFNGNQRTIDDMVECRADPRPGPEETTCSALRDQELARLVDQLPAGDRVVVELYAAGYRQVQIAELLGQPLGTIKSRMRRSVLRLRGAIEPSRLSTS